MSNRNLGNRSQTVHYILFATQSAFDETSLQRSGHSAAAIPFYRLQPKFQHKPQGLLVAALSVCAVSFRFFIQGYRADSRTDIV